MCPRNGRSACPVGPSGVGRAEGAGRADVAGQSGSFARSTTHRASGSSACGFSLLGPHVCVSGHRACLQGLLDVGGGLTESWREGKGLLRPEWAGSGQPAVLGIWEGAGLEGLMVLCACPPPDLRAGGAVRRGHRGVGTADVPRACDPGAALHFPGGLSVLWRRPAVRPGGRDGRYLGLAWTLWAHGAGPSESSSDKISPALWKNISTLASLGHSTRTERKAGICSVWFPGTGSGALSRLPRSLLELASLSEHISCSNTAVAAARSRPLLRGQVIQQADTPTEPGGLDSACPPA